MCFHLLKVFHLGRAYYFSEKKKHLCLTVSESVAFNVVTIIIEIKHKLPLQPFFVIYRKRLTV